MSYRLQGTHLFLTYPQCTLAPAEALTVLQTKTQLPPITEYIIAQEQHQDGTPHLHCYLKLASRTAIRSPTALDLGLFHGNYQSCRNRRAVLKYVTKDGTYITNLSPTELSNPSPTSASPYLSARRAVREGSSVQEALSHLEEDPKAARDLTIHGTSIVRNLSTIASRRITTTHSLASFNLTWQWEETKTLLLWGATGIGKTTLAKLLLPQALFVRHLDLLRMYGEGHYDGIVLDDMSFSHLPREAQIHLVDVADPTDIHIRYGVASLPQGTRRIITTNLVPEAILRLEDPAIARRVQAVEVLKSGDQYSYRASN